MGAKGGGVSQRKSQVEKKVHLIFPSVYPIKQDMARVTQGDVNTLLRQVDKLTKTATLLREDGLPEQPFIRNLQSDMVVEKCSDAREDLVGCNPKELYEATAGQLNCPPKEKATDPMIFDQDGRLCYARKALKEAWKQVKLDKKGKVIYEEMVNAEGETVRVPVKEDKTLDIDELTNKYASYLMNLISKNDKLQLALTSVMDTSGSTPPIILNYYRNNPYIIAFCENGSKKERRFRTGARDLAPNYDLKKFRGLKRFTVDNNFSDSRTRHEFVTLLTSFNSSLEVDSGAKFMSIFMNPLSPGNANIRGQFDIHHPINNEARDIGNGEHKLDFLDIAPFDRHDTSKGEVIHAVHCNVMELIFTAIATLHRDSVRYPKLKKFVNSLGDLLQFGELAPEVESPENKCRQAGVAAANAVAFLPQALKAWLANLPSTWRAPTPPELNGNEYMEQRVAGYIYGPTLVQGERDAAVASSEGRQQRFLLNTAIPPTALTEGNARNYVRSASTLVASDATTTARTRGGAEAMENPPLDYFARLSGIRPLAGGATSADTVDTVETDLALEGGAGTVGLYAADGIYGIVHSAAGRNEKRASAPTVVIGGETVEDPRIIMQNFISLCFYLNWVEMYGKPSSDTSILGLFKSLRVSYDNMMMARTNLEALLKTKAEEIAQRTANDTVSKVTEKMVDDAINNKRGADASYVGVNVRIAKKLAELLDIGWQNCESETQLQKEGKDPSNNGWHDKMLPHQKLFKTGAEVLPKFTVNQLPGISDNRVHFRANAAGVGVDAFQLTGETGYPDYEGARGDPSLARASWQIRDYDFVSTSIVVPEWVTKPPYAGVNTLARNSPVQVGNPVRYTYQYDESRSSVTGFGINTLEFRKAWVASYSTYEGIKTRKNYMNKVGYEQMQSRIMDLHLTFAQSCAKGREYFVKMFKYSKQTNFRKDGGIPEDPRSITKDMFDDTNVNALNDYQESVKKTKELMKPLKDSDICKVVLGDSQYFVFKNTTFFPTVTQVLQATQGAQRVYDDVTTASPGWDSQLVVLSREPIDPAGGGGPVRPVNAGARQVAFNEVYQKAMTIIEKDITIQVNTRPVAAPLLGVPAPRAPKYFGSCEPMDANDFNMYGRRRMTLDFDRPEDELFFIGVEAWAKLYTRSRFGPEAGRIRKYVTDVLREEGGIDRASIFREIFGVDYVAAAGAGANGVKLVKLVSTYSTTFDERVKPEDIPQGQRELIVRDTFGGSPGLFLGSETIPFMYSKEDSLRREGLGGSRTLTASERDAHARYTILLHKISGGAPSKLATRVLNMQNADEEVAVRETGKLKEVYGGVAGDAAGDPTPAAGLETQRAANFNFCPVAYAWDTLLPAIPAGTGVNADFKGIGLEDSRNTMTLRTFVAMNLVALSMYPTPLFATVGPLAGGEEELMGGSIAEVDAITADAHFSGAQSSSSEVLSPTEEFDNMMSEILTGGLQYKKKKVLPPQRQSPKSKRNNDDRTEEEVELDDFFESQGYKPVNRIKVGPLGPKLLNKYGTENTGTWVATSSPWLDCQQKMGVQFYTKTPRGIKYWYNDKAKCFKPLDASSQARDTFTKLEAFQNLARLINTATQGERAQELQKAKDVIAADPANDKLTVKEIEELAQTMLPGHLLELPTTSALKTASFIGEDVASQLNEITDNSEAEERARLTALIRNNNLMAEEWKDDDALVELERLKELVEDMVKSARTCTVISEAVRDNSSKADLKKNMRMIQEGDYAAGPNLQFKDSLSPRARLILDSEKNFASKCVVQEIGVNEAVLLPPGIANRIDTTELAKGGEAADKALNPVVQWWRQAYNRTLKKEKEEAMRIAEKIDPTRIGNAEQLTERSLEKTTLESKIENAVDENARKLLPSLDSYVKSSKRDE